MQGHDRLEIYYQVSSTLNRLAKDKNLNDLPALENLVDAYLVYTASTQKDLSPALLGAMDVPVVTAARREGDVIDPDSAFIKRFR